MFDSLKTMGALAGLMKNKEALAAAGTRIKARLGEITAAGSADSGAVRVDVNGRFEVVRVHIEPALAASLGSIAGSTGQSNDKALVEGLIAEAVNSAMTQARVLAQREIAREAEALGLRDIPGIEGLLGA